MWIKHTRVENFFHHYILWYFKIFIQYTEVSTFWGWQKGGSTKKFSKCDFCSIFQVFLRIEIFNFGHFRAYCNHAKILFLHWFISVFKDLRSWHFRAWKKGEFCTDLQLFSAIFFRLAAFSICGFVKPEAVWRTECNEEIRSLFCKLHLEILFTNP